MGLLVALLPFFVMVLKLFGHGLAFTKVLFMMKKLRVC